MQAIRVVQYGLGPIGCEFVRQMISRPGLEVVGGIDTDPEKTGQDLGQIANLGRRLGLSISDDPAALLAASRPDVVVHTTSSSLLAIRPQLEIILHAGCRVVTTCEEAAFPRLKHPQMADELDALARAGRTALVGTGINPGFAMDILAVAASAPCRNVQSVRVHRIVDASTRRLPLQRKIGAGLRIEEFAERQAAGTVKHVGLPESVALIAQALGWTLERIDERLEPVLAERVLTTAFLTIPTGHVAGIHQTAVGTRAGQPAIELTLDMFVGAPHPGEQVVLMGDDPLEMRITGIHGDAATAAVGINAIPRLLAAPAGFLTMLDLPVVGYWEH